MTSTSSTTTTPDGVSLTTRHWKAADPKASMLIVHGLGEHSGRYEQTGADFADRGFDVASFDLRGFGASAGHRAFVERFDVYLADVELQLAERRMLGLPVVLLGHSMGGLIALEYALSTRPRPDLLVISAPALAADVPTVKKVAARALSKIAPKLALPNDIEADQLSTDPSVGEAYFVDPLVYTKTTARLGAELLATMEHANANMSALDIPTMVIHGGADTVVPPASSAPLGELENVERILFPSFRHESFNELERGKAVDAVATWIDSRLAPGES